MATADRLEAIGWWPTKGTPPKTDYTGPVVCGSCRASHATTQSTTAMCRTAGRAVDSEVLRAHRSLTFAVGHHSYEIVTAGHQR